MVFARHSDALKAIKKYNGKLLDRRPIKIETIGGSFVPSAPSTGIDGSLGYQRGAFRRYVVWVFMSLACSHEEALLVP